MDVVNNGQALPPETMLWNGSPSQRVAAIKPLAVAIILGASFIYKPDAWTFAARICASLYPPQAELASLAPIAFACAIFTIFFYGYAYAVTTKYTCTSERLIIQQGLLSRSEDEIELYRVIDIVQTAHIMQMLLGVGSVTIKNTDQTGTITMPSITAASDVRNIVRSAAEQCKARRVRVFAE
jgi:membrane protein YdbS with pleckstrin-like domain